MSDETTAGTRIRIADAEYTLSWVREHPGRCAGALGRAKLTVGYAECLCIDPPRRLVIRGSRSGRMHLARWPGDGDAHANSCAFHQLPLELSGRSAYTASAILEPDDGPTSIRFGSALVRTTSDRVRVTPHSTTGGSATGRRSVGLLGLLHWVWTESGLTRWPPEGIVARGAQDANAHHRRHWSKCAAAVRECSRQAVINGRALADVLWVVPAFTTATADTNADAFRDFLTTLAPTPRGVPRGLVLGEVKSIRVIESDPVPARPRHHARRRGTPTGGARAARTSVAYHLAHHRRPLYASDALDAKARISYRPAYTQRVRDLGGTALGLFVIERTATGHARIVDMALMPCTAHYIPVDSSYELELANELVAQSRSFTKPLRFDASADAVFPDFILTDTDPITRVEVYGVRGRADYDRRKQEKNAYYQRSGLPLHAWNVGEEPMPDLRLAR